MDDTTTDSPLSGARRREIISNLRALQVAEGLSYTTIARSVGVSASVLSQILRSRYRGNADRYLRQVARWMSARAERAEAPAADYAATSIGRLVMTVCRRAWSMPTIGIIVTPSGAGKTAALREYARRRGDRAVLLTPGEAACTKRGLLGELARMLHVTVYASSTIASLYHGVHAKLAGYYAGGKGDPLVVIVDEATTIRPDAKHLLRNLHDDPAVRCGLVFADTGRLRVELHNRSGRAMYEQIRSRAGAQYLMAVDDEIPVADVRAVADSVLSALGRTRPLARPSYTYLHRLAQLDGKLRNVVHRLHAVADLAEARGAPATWTVAQLDYAAMLVGMEAEMTHEAPPFATADRGGPKPGRTAVA